MIAAGLRPHRQPAGFTLLEVMLTLVLLVVLGSMVWPSLSRTIENQNLLKSADRLRIEWARARVKAITSGQVYAFRFEPAGNRYITQAWAAIEPPEPAAFASPLATAAATTPAVTEDREEGTLPGSVRFLLESSQREVDSRTTAYEQANQTAGAVQENWSPPLFFYPDGRTSSAKVALTNGNGRTVAVELRGLTGVARILDQAPAAQGVAP